MDAGDHQESDPAAEVKLAADLAALASPVRLALLRQVRSPRALKEIRIRTPAEAATESRPSRILARQTVKEHLDKLVETGVVTAREVEREYGAAAEYVINHQALFALSEEFRGLARLRPTEDPAIVTRQGKMERGAGPDERPCLILVKGLDEGRTFPLGSAGSAPREWIIGRRRGLAVSLDFDPFVSTENARVLFQEGAYWVEDLPVSRNGTFVNFRPMARGGRHPLAGGDVIGIGRSLLLFRA